MSQRLTLVLVAVVALVWGGHWPIMKLGLEDMPPLTYGALRVGTGLATLAAILAATRSLRLPPARDVPVVVAVGLGQVAGSIALTNVALLVAPAGRASVLLYTMPLWVAAIQTFVLRIFVTRREAAGLGLGTIGIVLLMCGAPMNWQSSAGLLSVACLLGAANIWAITTIYIRRHEWTASPLELQPWELALALVPLIALAVTFEHAEPVQWHVRTVAILAFSGPIATAFAYWASQSISRALTPIGTTTGMLAVPIVGLASSAVFLGESVGLLDALAFALALAGIILVSVHGSIRTSGDAPAPPVLEGSASLPFG